MIRRDPVLLLELIEKRIHGLYESAASLCPELYATGAAAHYYDAVDLVLELSKVLEDKEAEDTKRQAVLSEISDLVKDKTLFNDIK